MMMPSVDIIMLPVQTIFILSKVVPVQGRQLDIQYGLSSVRMQAHVTIRTAWLGVKAIARL